MAKLTTEAYSREMMVLSKWPRKSRDLAVRQLTEQAVWEDAQKRVKEDDQKVKGE